MAFKTEFFMIHSFVYSITHARTHKLSLSHTHTHTHTHTQTKHPHPSQYELQCVWYKFPNVSNILPGLQHNVHCTIKLQNPNLCSKVLTDKSFKDNRAIKLCECSHRGERQHRSQIWHNTKWCKHYDYNLYSVSSHLAFIECNHHLTYKIQTDKQTSLPHFAHCSCTGCLVCCHMCGSH